MFLRWNKLKSGKSGAPAGAGAGAAREVAVQKVDKIEVRNLVTRPDVSGAPRPRRGGGGAEGEDKDIDWKAAEFIKQRKIWFHSQKPAGATAPRPPSSW